MTTPKTQEILDEVDEIGAQALAEQSQFEVVLDPIDLVVTDELTQQWLKGTNPDWMKRSSFTMVLGMEIIALRRMGLSMTKISELEGMPHVSNMKRWMLHIPEFRNLWELASMEYADMKFDEMMDIAESANSTNYQAKKLQIDAIKWDLAKRNRQKFGDYQKVESTHSVGGSLEDALRDAVDRAKG